MSDSIEEVKTQLAEVQQRAEKWERLHTEATIKRELLAAGQQGGAFHAPQLLPFLEPKAKLVEVNGQHVVRVVTTDEQGKEVMHTPAQAVANMKKHGDYANLFRETMVAKSTLAAPATPMTPDKIDWDHITHPEYLKIRQEHPEWLGLKPSPKKGR
jgi:hypothetical protein